MNKKDEGIYKLKYHFLFALVAFALLTAEKCNDESTSIVKLTFTRTSSYCGGAAPADFILKELATPVPLNGKMLYLYNTNNLCVDSFYVKGDSTYKTMLINGTYSVRLVDTMVKVDDNDESESNCLQAFNQRSMAEINVTSDTSFAVNLHFDCNPCYPPPP